VKSVFRPQKNMIAYSIRADGQTVAVYVTLFGINASYHEFSPIWCIQYMHRALLTLKPEAF